MTTTTSCYFLKICAEDDVLSKFGRYTHWPRRNSPASGPPTRSRKRPLTLALDPGCWRRGCGRRATCVVWRGSRSRWSWLPRCVCESATPRDLDSAPKTWEQRVRSEIELGQSCRWPQNKLSIITSTNKHTHNHIHKHKSPHTYTLCYLPIS